MRGAGLARRAGDDRDPAVVAFVRVVGARLDHQADLLGRQQLDLAALDAVDDVVGNADVGNHHVARVVFTRRQHQRQLGRRQRHRHRRRQALTEQVRRVGGEPARQVHGHDRDAHDVDVGHHGFQQAGERCAQPGADDRIDDERAPLHFRGVELPALLVVHFHDADAEAAEDLEVDLRVALHLRDRRQQEHRHVDATLRQRPRHHEAVAAVVALAAEDRRRGPRGGPRTPTRWPTPPAGRRSPSAPARRCRPLRSSGDRPRASGWR